jgi:hypothetical protein
MLVVTVIFMPIILAYTAWVYKVLWGKVTEADVTILIPSTRRIKICGISPGC